VRFSGGVFWKFEFGSGGFLVGGFVLASNSLWCGEASRCGGGGG